MDRKSGVSVARYAGAAVRAWLVVLAALVLSGPALAGRADVVKGEIISVGLGALDGNGGLYREGAWVPVLVRLQNRTGEEFVGQLGVEQTDLDGDSVVSMGPKVILPGGDVESHDYWMYYWPTPSDDGKGAGSVLVFRNGSVVQTINLDPGKGARGITPLGVDRYSEGRAVRWVVVLGSATYAWGNFYHGGTEGVVATLLPNARQLPDSALGLDGVDVVVWQADRIKASDMAGEFQLKALLSWVRSGGHLIISAASQGNELVKSHEALRDALPLTPTGTRQIPIAALADVTGVMPRPFLMLSNARGELRQLTGTMEAGARPVFAMSGAFAEHPLAVTRAYGRGAVTLLTVDMEELARPEIERPVRAEMWLEFWSQVGGWGGGNLLTADEVQRRDQQKIEEYSGMGHLSLGDEIPTLVDVTEVTTVRLLVAVLFLAVYWLIAGPLGYMVLRYYKIGHWSWWVFGGTVVAAAAVAGVVVMSLKLTSYDVRHRTVVIGTVGSNEVSVVGYYGVFAPTSGLVEVKYPETGSDTLSYLTPMCVAGTEAKPFADPQRYGLDDGNAASARVISRNTLKKMQGRWTGRRSGIEGKAELTGDHDRPFKGTLVNRSGYDLVDVEFVVNREERGTTRVVKSYLCRAETGGVWKKGAELDLSKVVVELTPRDEDRIQGDLELQRLLGALGLDMAPVERGFGGGLDTSRVDKRFKLAADRMQNSLHARDLLALFYDTREPDSLGAGRVEVERPLVRTMDVSKLLRASGAMIVARAGDVAGKDYVPSPVEIQVAGSVVPGKGEVVFAWALPVTGNAGVGNSISPGLIPRNGGQ